MNFIEEVAGRTSGIRIAENEGEGARIDKVQFTARVRGAVIRDQPCEQVGQPVHQSRGDDQPVGLRHSERRHRRL